MEAGDLGEQVPPLRQGRQGTINISEDTSERLAESVVRQVDVKKRKGNAPRVVDLCLARNFPRF